MVEIVLSASKLAFTKGMKVPQCVSLLETMFCGLFSFFEINLFTLTILFPLRTMIAASKLTKA